MREQVFASVRSSLFSTSGLSMGMRRMTAFPYEMLRKTTRYAQKKARATTHRDFEND